MRLSVIILVGTLFYIAAPAAAFFPLTWDDLMFQMEKRMSWKRAKMETVVQVFDPFAKNADGEFSKNLLNCRQGVLNRSVIGRMEKF